MFWILETRFRNDSEMELYKVFDYLVPAFSFLQWYGPDDPSLASALYNVYIKSIAWTTSQKSVIKKHRMADICRTLGTTKHQIRERFDFLSEKLMKDLLFNHESVSFFTLSEMVI